LIIYDRSEDPVTPLLTQWTYQAMVHDNFQIIHNIVNVKKEKLVFSSKEDDFLNENKDKVFADVASIIKDKIDNISKDKNDDMQSFDDIKKYIENLPSKKKERVWS
jgi:vacuolar protein sorting-associated protein 45